jgi:hypothetical protein
MREVGQNQIRKQRLPLYEPPSLLQVQAPTILSPARIDVRVLLEQATEPPSFPIHAGSMSDYRNKKEMRSMSRSGVFSVTTTSFLPSIHQKCNARRV